MGVFHVFKIVQMVLNRATHHKYQLFQDGDFVSCSMLNYQDVSLRICFNKVRRNKIHLAFAQNASVKLEMKCLFRKDLKDQKKGNKPHSTWRSSLKEVPNRNGKLILCATQNYMTLDRARRSMSLIRKYHLSQQPSVWSWS